MTAPERQSWRKIRDRIHDAILSGRFAPGERLPRDADLATELNCARATVQRAMQDLADAGLVERRRRGGTTLRPDPVTRATFEIPVIRREVEGRGARYGYQLLRQSRAAPPRAIRAAFDTFDTTPMLHVEALHLSDARPYLLEDRWISMDTVPNIASIDLSRTSANEWLVLNQRYSHGNLHFSAETADAKTAGLMATNEGAALFVMERTTWLESAPVTHVRAIAAPGYRMHARI